MGYYIATLHFHIFLLFSISFLMKNTPPETAGYFFACVKSCGGRSLCIQGALFRSRRYGVFLLPKAFRKNIFIVPGIGNYAVRKVNFNPLKAVERRRNKGYCSVFVRITRFIVRNRAELIVFSSERFFTAKLPLYAAPIAGKASC